MKTEKNKFGKRNFYNKNFCILFSVIGANFMEWKIIFGIFIVNVSKFYSFRFIKKTTTKINSISIIGSGGHLEFTFYSRI